jgi:hypothetical protein
MLQNPIEAGGGWWCGAGREGGVEGRGMKEGREESGGRESEDLTNILKARKRISLERES